jgi:dephospho-CoA kinase
LRTRGRSDDPSNWEEFEERDLRELKVGLGEVIALADEMIVNEGTIDELAESGRAIFEAILNVESDCCIC